MTNLDTLLLLALPASGKSEIRRYLAHVEPDVAERDFHLGPTVQLDDYPYVQLMRRIDDVLAGAGGDRVFYTSREGTFAEPREWGTLTRILAEDYARLGAISAPSDPTAHLIERIDRARIEVGAPPASASIPPGLWDAVAKALDEEIASFVTELSAESSRYGPSSTVVVEFARGGPEGAGFPLLPPHGYAYSLPLLGPDMLRRASILYVWVTPEESRRRNRDRVGPGAREETSVLHHRVPETVMRGDYGTDDLPLLIERGDGAVEVESEGRVHRIPAAVFDNRRDRTSFLRDPPGTWPADRLDEIHKRLQTALTSLAEASGRDPHP